MKKFFLLPMATIIVAVSIAQPMAPMPGFTIQKTIAANKRNLLQKTASVLQRNPFPFKILKKTRKIRFA